MPQLNFITWLPYLITCWALFILTFFLLNNLNNQEWSPRHTATETLNNPLTWPWTQ
uniref:ATP synthase complex subunit 8 n=1 Tax=Ophiomastix mixta TaxID=2705303 RepID=A0A6C0FMW6_9ECHI|nr:ATP synthase F0 subunit 8 [Ophiomastix mixta]QHT54185.1 ATP synthase F0 subunit 8 [Ophiomastix mixta]